MSSILTKEKSRTKKVRSNTAKIQRAVDLIKSIEIENAFNPYIHTCPIHDNSKSKSIREQNLYQYLEYHLLARPKILWLGRDLGYRGGRRTGIPLTDEVHLADLSSALHCPSFSKATKTELTKERTATEVWKIVAHFKTAPFMWNVFPFHPYAEKDPMSNRNHTREEFEETKCILDCMLELFQFDYFFALGRDAYAVLEEIGLEPVYVRHPSHGGQSQFRKTIIEETPRTYTAFAEGGASAF